MKFRNKNMEICIMPTVKNNGLLHLDQMLELDVFEVSHAKLDTSWNYKNVCYSFSQVYIPVNGCGYLLLEEMTLKLIPGNIYIVPAGAKYSCKCESTLEKHMIDFSLTFPDKADILLGAPCVVLEQEHALIDAILPCMTAADFSAVLGIRRYLFEILCKAFAKAPALLPKSPEYSPSTNLVLPYINANLSAQLSIPKIADALFLSKLTLQRHFTADMGISIGKYIDQRLMTAAQRLLLDQNLSIRQISEQLGFSDQFYFCKKFTQYFGANPSSFRAQHK